MEETLAQQEKDGIKPPVEFFLAQPVIGRTFAYELIQWLQLFY
jgi:hypothetical protein